MRPSRRRQSLVLTMHFTLGAALLPPAAASSSAFSLRAAKAELAWLVTIEVGKITSESL
jgi:hypothetical protein